MRVVEAINHSLHSIMEEDDRAYFIGQDILDPYGGAFKVSKGLSTRFPNRVLPSPISEAAMLGFGVGLALRGRTAIVEFMFGDFLTLGMDQLVNHAAKFEWLYDNEISMPLIVRAPMGGGRGYGPTHSQSLEKHFCGVPGLNVYAVHRYMDIQCFYAEIKKAGHPALIIENKVMYAQPVQDFKILKPEGDPDIIFVTYGVMIDVCIKAAEVLHQEDEIVSEILPLQRLYPLDKELLLEAGRRCKRIVVVEEAPSGWGFGAECAYALVNLPVIFAHVSAADHPIPSARVLEEQALPSTQNVVAAVRKIF